MRAALAFSALVVAAPSYAVQVPAQVGNDPRVRTVEYSDTDVVRLDIAYGNMTLVRFSSGEVVVDGGPGENSYWVKKANNAIWIKPKERVEGGAGGNYIVMTNKRTYLFSVNVVAHADKAAWELRFSYPAEVAEKAASVAVASTLADRSGDAVNLCYQFKGSMSVRPEHAWDNGMQTWFQFAGPVPAVYSVSVDGKEVLTDGEAESPGVLRMSQTSRRWMMRLGSDVVEVQVADTDSKSCYAASGPYTPRRSQTGTVSGSVERVMKVVN